MTKISLLIFIMFFNFGCLVDKSKLAVSFQGKNKKHNVVGNVTYASISSVQIINNQLVINGNGLNDVSNVKVDGSAFTENFLIESKTATKIIANSIRAFSFDVSKVFNVILSDANASVTFPIDFSLCNASLNGRGFDCAAPIADKDVLSYDAVSGKWKPRAVSGLNYLGAFNASSNPATGPATQPAGAYYIISASGTIAGITFTIGDWLVSNGSAWQKIDNSTAVLSVFGRNGAVTAQTGDYDLSMLGDVSFPTAPVAGKVLKFDGTNWVAGDDLSGGGAGSVNTTEIADGAITDVKVSSVSTSKLTGTISSAQITDGTIVNADINAAAAIDYSKLNIADGEIPAAKISGLPVLSSILAVTITDGDTTHAPTGEAVYEALQTKIGTGGGTLLVGTISGVPTPVGPSDVVNKAYVDSLVTLFDSDDIAEGSQLYFTEARVLGTDLAGLNTGVNGPITAADTVLSAFGKMQYQVTDLKAKGQWDKTVNDISYSAGNVSIDKKLRLKSDNANYVEMLSPNGLASTYTLTLPANDGNANQVLKTDGAGVLAWVDVNDASVQAFAKSALPTCAGGEVLKSNGTTFSCITDNTGAGAFSGTANSAVITTAGGALGVSTTTSTELGYVSGVTSAIQTQLNNKQAALGFTPINKAGDTISSGTFTFSGTSALRAADPIAATDVVNKQYFENFGQWSKNGSDIYRSSGNVGIGLTSPQANLDVNGGVKVSAASTGRYTGAEGLLLDYLPGTGARIMQVTGASGSAAAIIFGTADTERLRISSTGNIGIGTSNPTTDLSFNGNVARTISLTTQITNAGNNLTLKAGDAGSTTTNQHGGSLVLSGGAVTGSATSSKIEFKTAEGVAASGVVTSPTTKMTLSGEGYIGLGTTTPTGRLDIKGSGQGGPNSGAFFNLLRLGNATALDFGEYGGGDSWIQSSNRSNYATKYNITLNPDGGNVGIGRTSPQSKLDVNGSVRIAMDATACSGTIAGAMRFNTPNVEYCNGTAWTAFGASNAAVSSTEITNGTIVDADINAAANITATKLGTGAVDNTEFNYLNGVTSSIQTQIDGKQATDATLTSLAAYNTNGILVQTTADTFVGRSIAGTANRVTVTNGDGVSGNPTVNIPTALLPSPVVGDVGKFLKATAADTSVWTALGLSDVTTALGYTPLNNAGETVTTGTFTFNNAAVLRTLNPIAGTDVANKQYVDSVAGLWQTNGTDVHRLSGNVGIGTATPSDRLDVNGSTRLRGMTYIATESGLHFIDAGNSTSKIVTKNGGIASGEVEFWSSGPGINFKNPWGINSMFIALGDSVTPGNVGIGTTAPLGKLDINWGGANGFVGGADINAATRTNNTNKWFRYGQTQYANANAPFLAIMTGSTSTENGVYFGGGTATQPNATALRFYTGTSQSTNGSAVERMTITSTGNVGVGTTTPGAKFALEGTGAVGFQMKTTSAAAVDTMNLINDMDATGNFWFAKGTTSTAAPAAADKLMNITNEGNLEVYGQQVNGTTDASGVLALKTQSSGAGGTKNEVSIEFYADRANLNTMSGFVGYESGTAFDMTMKNTKAGSLILGTNNTDNITILSDGKVGIGTTTPSYTLHVNGSVAGTGAYNSLSDARLKKDIKVIPNSLEKISALRGVSFNWDKEAHPELELNDRGELGVIAQEVQKVFPNAVTVDKKTGILSVAYSMLIAPLIEAVKDLFNDSKELKREIASLKKDNELKAQQIKKNAEENQELKKRLDKIEKLLNKSK